MSLNLKQRIVYVIGGGNVAYRKVVQFLREGAEVVVISPEIDSRITHLENITIMKQPFSWALISEDCFYLYAATNDSQLNQAIKEEAKRRHLLFGCSMYMEDCDVYSMYTQNTETVQFALSTNGTCAGADRGLYEHYLSTQLSIMDEHVKALNQIRSMLYEQGVSATIIKTVLKELAQIDGSYSKQMIKSLETKKVMLLAYHGIADVKQETNTLHQMQELVETEFPDYTCMSVFTSTKILNKAKQKEYHIASISCMSSLCELLSISYCVQPMLLQRGTMYDELVSHYNNVVGIPLWNTQKEFLFTYHSLKNKYPRPLLGLYHPSNQMFDVALLDTEDHFLPFEQVKINQITQKNLMVIPFVLLYGYHAKKDIEQKWVPVLWKKGISATLIKSGLLANQEVQHQFINLIKQSINEAS